MKRPSKHEGHVFDALMAVIENRKMDMPAGSYSASLFAGGIDKISGKVIEEAKELVEAGAESAKDANKHIAHEAADLLYHMFVLLAHCSIPLKQVEGELWRRFGASGLDEKAARGRKGESRE